MKCLCHAEKQVSIEISFFVNVCKLFLLSYSCIDVLFETRAKSLLNYSLPVQALCSCLFASDFLNISPRNTPALIDLTHICFIPGAVENILFWGGPKFKKRLP